MIAPIIRRLIANCSANGPLPDPRCTPGAATNDTRATICKPGYAGSHRKVSAITKAFVYHSYGILKHPPGAYEIDHLVPLELGGSNAVDNLWPQPASTFHAKDKVENQMHNLVCAGHRDLATVQAGFATDWTTVK